VTGVWAIVPVKRLTDSKSRLAPALSAGQRCALSLALLKRTLALAAEFPGSARTLVVSRDETALALAASGGFASLAEAPDADLNGALEQARRMAIERGATALLVVAIDLPLLTTADLRALAASGIAPRAATLAGDRHGTGTNGLYLKPADLIPFRFGEASLEAHRRALKQCGIAPKSIARPGFALDLDTPDDLAELRARAPHAIPLG